MHKQIIGYIPANLIPAIVSFGMIYAYTRILTPASFGAYSFVFSFVLVVQISVYFAIPLAVMRFYPAAQVARREALFLRESYTVFYAVTALLVSVAAVALWVIPLAPAEADIAWIGIPLLVLRSVVGLNQAVNRSSDSMAHYNTIECVHAILGFLLGLLFIYLWGPTARSVLLGLLAGAAACAVIDLRLLVSPIRRTSGQMDRNEIVRIARFAWPLMVASMSGCLLQLSDRFIVGGLGSTVMLGIYTVAYSLVERPTTVLCLSISTATFSMAVQALETRGRQAGRMQAGKNAVVLLALVLPACVGLAMTSRYIAAVLVGPAFQEGVATLIPIMCFTALTRGVRAHLIDHAFHFAGRPNLMLWSYGPAAVANILLNLVAVPRYGMLGAACVALFCQVIAATVGWFVGRRVFPLWVPLGPLLRIVAAVVPMALALWLIEFPLTWTGLIAAVALGMIVFGLSAVLFNLGGVRSRIPVPRRLRRVNWSCRPL